MIALAMIQANIHGRFTMTLLGKIPRNLMFHSSIIMEEPHNYSYFTVLLKGVASQIQKNGQNMD